MNWIEIIQVKAVIFTHTYLFVAKGFNISDGIYIKKKHEN